MHYSRMGTVIYILIIAIVCVIGYYSYKLWSAPNDGFYNVEDVDFKKTDRKMRKMHSGYGKKTVVDGKVMAQ